MSETKTELAARVIASFDDLIRRGEADFAAWKAAHLERTAQQIRALRAEQKKSDQ